MLLLLLSSTLLASNTYILLVRNGTDISRDLTSADRLLDAVEIGTNEMLYNVSLSPESLSRLRSRNEIEIEEDAVISVQKSRTIQPNLTKFSPPKFSPVFTGQFLVRLNSPWSLGFLTNSSSFEYFSNIGRGVAVFVLDTGIDTTHPEFRNSGRVVENCADFTNKNSRKNQKRKRSKSRTNGNNDDNGHGTHIAGIIGGVESGVAKHADLLGVKILDSSGRGRMYSMYRGIHYAVNRARRSGLTRVVVNLSIAGAKNAQINKLINRMSNKKNVVFVTAAGNFGQSSCAYTPGSSRCSITVGAVDRDGLPAPFTNSGPCIDVYAPGVGIRSASPGGAYATMDGTSMAAPHVSGVAAAYLSLTELTAAEVKEVLIQDAMVVGGVRVASLVQLYERLSGVVDSSSR